ncbi:MAG TPA: oligosaccharide flippase family protein [Pyrinomonadaceae bacterium]|jgi:O-antigen/teichoic acid export membrane protein|nr:oligosaccharide flippase family protein [Pyrinomonadaceae bacterium]
MTAHTTLTGEPDGAGETSALSSGASHARRNFPAQVAWTLAARVLMAANSVVVGVVVARWLGAEGLGTLAVLNLTIAYAVQIGSMGLASANTYFIARDPRLLAPAATNALVFATVVGAALALLTLWLATSAVQLFGDIPAPLFAMAVLSIPFQLLTLFGLNIFLAVGRVARFNLLDTLAQTLLLVNAIVALVVLKAGLRTLISLNTAASIAVGVVVVWLVANYVRGRRDAGERRTEAKLFASMMRYGLKVHAQTVASLLLFRVDLLIVKYFRGAAEAGVYSVASQVALMLMLLPGVIATLLFPRIAAERDERGVLAARVTRHTAFVMLLVCLAAVPAVFALPLLYGRMFTDATTQALILLPGVFLVSVGGVLAQHFSGTGLPVALPLFWVAALGLNTALNFALVPAFGPRGAALSSSASYALVFALIALYFRARTNTRLRTAFLMSGAELRGLLNFKRLASFFG